MTVQLLSVWLLTFIIKVMPRPAVKVNTVSSKGGNLLGRKSQLIFQKDQGMDTLSHLKRIGKGIAVRWRAT